MIHHSGEDYKVAAGKAAEYGRDKLQKIIDDGRASAGAVIENVLAKVVTDRIVRANVTKIVPPIEKGGWTILQESEGSGSGLHPNAWDQILADAGMPKTFIKNVVGETNGTEWGKELIAHNVNTILSHRDKQRNLVRSENGKVMGWLSDRYRRLDSRPLLEAFVASAKQMDMVPIQGIASDTKCRLRAVLPQIFEPIPGEVMVFGLEWGNSDYGDGGHVVNLWTMRMMCTNLAITDQTLRQVHLGKRLDDNIQYSNETYRLDTQANASALRDAVRHAIGPDRLNPVIDAISAASEEEVKGKDVGTLLKKHFEKADVDRITTLFESPDETNMPAGQNLWRLSNAISWLAQTKGTTPDRRIELETIAGKLIPHKALKPMEA